MSWFKHRESDEMAGLRAEVQSLQGRLAADVSILDPGQDPPVPASDERRE